MIRWIKTIIENKKKKNFSMVVACVVERIIKDKGNWWVMAAVKKTKAKQYHIATSFVEKSLSWWLYRHKVINFTANTFLYTWCIHLHNSASSTPLLHSIVDSGWFISFEFVAQTQTLKKNCIWAVLFSIWHLKCALQRSSTCWCM